MNIFSFKLITPEHFLLLFQWFSQDYIAQLWVEPTEWTAFQTTWNAKIAEPGVFRYLAYLDNKPIGYIQYFRVTDKDRAHFSDVQLPDHSIGLDLFIGDQEYLGKGYGTRLIQDFIELIQVKEPACSTIIIDPAPDNVRAIKCYEKVGFKRVGIFTTPYGPKGAGPGQIMLMIYENNLRNSK